MNRQTQKPFNIIMAQRPAHTKNIPLHPRMTAITSFGKRPAKNGAIVQTTRTKSTVSNISTHRTLIKPKHQHEKMFSETRRSRKSKSSSNFNQTKSKNILKWRS